MRLISRATGSSRSPSLPRRASGRRDGTSLSFFSALAGPAGASSWARARTRLPRTSTSARPSSSFSSTPCQPSPRWRTGSPPPRRPQPPLPAEPEMADRLAHHQRPVRHRLLLNEDGGTREQRLHRLGRQPLAPSLLEALAQTGLLAAQALRGVAAELLQLRLHAAGDAAALVLQGRPFIHQSAPELLGVGALGLQALAGLGQLLAHPLHLGDQPPEVAVLGAQPRLGPVEPLGGQP